MWEWVGRKWRDEVEFCAAARKARRCVVSVCRRCSLLHLLHAALLHLSSWMPVLVQALPGLQGPHKGPTGKEQGVELEQELEQHGGSSNTQRQVCLGRNTHKWQASMGRVEGEKQAHTYCRLAGFSRLTATASRERGT